MTLDTIEASKDKSEALLWTAIQYKSDMQDTLLRLKTRVYEICKPDKVLTALIIELSTLITISTQTIEDEAVDLSTELALVK